MKPLRAVWEDVVTALELEAVELGNDVAWDLERVRQWWDSGVETAFAIRDGDRLVAYACVMHLLPEAFEGIVSGSLDPADLKLTHTTTDATHHWLGIVITHPAYRNQGAGTLVLSALCDALSGQVVADVYSKQGRALLERTGWKLVRESPRPIYTTELSRCSKRPL